MSSMTRQIPFLSFLLVMGAGCAPRQQPVAQAGLPVPLVAALIDDRGSLTRASPIFTDGVLPPGYPASLVPSGPVRIIGGMTAGDNVVAIFADSTRRLPLAFEQVFEQAGFTRPAPSGGSGFTSGSGPYNYFCGDSGTVQVEPLAAGIGSYTRVRFHRSRVNPCRMYRTTESAERPYLTLPELKAPAGARVARSGGGTNSDGVNSRAEMTGTDLVASRVLAHYADQLIAAGWVSDPPAVGGRVAAQFFEAKDASGRVWQGVLQATGGGAALTLSLNMHPRATR